MRGPYDLEVWCGQAQDDDDGADGEGLACLSADAHADAADRAGVGAVGAFGEHERADALLPSVELDAEPVGDAADAAEAGGGDAVGDVQDSGGVR